MMLAESFRQLKTLLRATAWQPCPLVEELPLRAELFSADQMAQHGKALAISHRLATGRLPDQLLTRLAENEHILLEVCDLLTHAGPTKNRITPAGEWLLDNFYLIEEQIRTTRHHLPKGYSRELPRLAQGASSGRPRVYDIALEIISHGDGRVDTEVLSRFVMAYQTVTDLKLGELWAIPIMLRLAVIENLRRVAVQISSGWSERDLANIWANQMIETAELDPKSLILVIADMARSKPPMVSAFVAELARRLQGRGPALALPLTWIEQRLSESGVTIENLIQAESQRQAADQVSISNSISSLRILGAIDWREFVETMSVVEQILLNDPNGIYGRMDFSTRDHYRHAAESIAQKGCLTEREVARKAVDLSCASASVDATSRAAHVGFYLVDQGLPVLEQAAEVQHSLIQSIPRVARKYPLFLYLGNITLVTILLTSGLLALALTAGFPIQVLGVLGLLFLLVSSQLAVALVNWLVTLLVMPHPLPKMDYSKGMAPASRTLVVIPTMLTNLAGVEHLIEALEVRFLANRDVYLHFGLLTDFCDNPEASHPNDAALILLAQTRIAELNDKYGCDGGLTRDDIFFLFHRPRRWHQPDNVWMGYERKRGKLADLNALLRGAAWGSIDDGFSLIVGNPSVLIGVKYVITLDTDTQLPRDAARQFVGAMAHPLNHPQYDASKNRITAGYGILQPRVAISLPGTNRSHYARLYGGETGIDPYTRAISDVYQDIFGEGSFIGKGIYDVDAFEQTLGGRFPENRILSHDLLEGCYARSGLLSDVQLYEDYPARYNSDVGRRYRWIRGDWQLAGWLLSHVPDLCQKQSLQPQKNSLSVLSQWKLIDNLRRSLVPAALMLMLLLGWAQPAMSWVWTLVVIGILLIPSLFATALDLLRKPSEVLLVQYLTAALQTAARHGTQLAFELACLPYEAYYSIGAIWRTMWRLCVSGHKLLQWNPSSEAERESGQRGRNTLMGSFRTMWIAPVIAISVGAYLILKNPAALLLAWPILLLWLASPFVAWWISRPLIHRKASLTTEQTRFLRGLSRRTWAFFDTFAGSENNWLPPDNYQEYRVATVAHRTSPTNIGLALLANLAAYDFGYILAGTLLQRTANTLRTMESLARYRGHFYNWYDTQTLQPMLPQYVSTVDSGNLAGHLLTLRAGFSALADDRILPIQLFDGLNDTLRVLGDTANEVDTGLMTALHLTLAQAVATPLPTLIALHALLAELVTRVTELSQQVIDDSVLKNSTTPGNEEVRFEVQTWADALVRQCAEAKNELNFLAPWLLLPAAPEGLPAFVHLTAIPTLRELAQLDVVLHPQIEQLLAMDLGVTQHAWLTDFLHAIATGSQRARDRITEINSLVQRAGDLSCMEYEFLYDKTRNLLRIGYNVSERRLDSGYYDLLASEVRLGCFVAIAQGQLPQESWFALGRLLTGTGGKPVLLSWSGSMFEYLMPMLVMPTYENTLLDQTCRAAVARQIEYGKQRGVPWGISESGYNTVDIQLNYQYRAFGVPGLGLKRGLSEDLVVAPYASVMALMVEPEAACQNLQRLEHAGLMGRYGLYEAVDYTPVRQRRGQSSVVIRAFMAHHQGMSMLALAYQMLDRPMQRRFESDRLFQASMLLLQERVPKAMALFSHTAQRFDMAIAADSHATPIRVLNSPDTPIPEVQLLSNGRYHVLVTNAGGGYSRWKDLAVTRWREDGTSDNWGSFCYIRETGSGAFWSTAHQPTLNRPQSYEAIFSEGRAEFRHCESVGFGDGDIETHTEIVVSPEDDIELRRVRITNRSRVRRAIDVTSYAEVVLTSPAADALHPAFSNLFVQTEILRDRRAILCTRRPRSADQSMPWMLHLMSVHGVDSVEVSYETDRMRFIGRGRTPVSPKAMRDLTALSGTEGSVLDPIVAIRHSIVLEPEQSAIVDIVSGIADTREQAVGLIGKYQDRHLADRVFDLAWTHSQVVLRQLNATEAEAQLYAHLASSIVFANADLRAETAILLKNRRGQSGLWSYAISGDLPIVLLRIGNANNIDLVRNMVQAHAYWRLKGLAVDLVIWNEDHAGYRQQLQDQIMGMIASGTEASVIDRPGGIFVRLGEQISGEDRILLQSVARAVITDELGTLAEQLENRGLVEPHIPRLIPTRSHRLDATPAAIPQQDLILSNGLGGFTPDGREYVMTLALDQVTPAPWVNVLANPNFGTVISENGVAYTWGENAHEFRLTPWHNDPVSDTSGEALYLRDEETGYVWSPTPLPVRTSMSYTIRHGFGYSVFETKSVGIRTELWVYVARDAAVKFSVLKIHNESGRSRKLSATGYVEWVLGDLRARSAMHITTEIDRQSGALLARNPYSTEFSDHVAFFDVDDPKRSVTGDRVEFLGRNGTLRNPAAMNRARLSGKVGAGLDPCGAIQVSVDLADAQGREVIFRLGMGRNTEDAARLVQRFRGAVAGRAELDVIWQYWNHTLGAVQVETPDPSVNVMANGWLVYQTLACRLWARSGYYQSGGAFGFRDQLQDAMALIHTEPGLLRNHLLLCASRQFVEGDVQHWWHPPSGRGVRTRCSDDYLWLPLAVSRYVNSTGDTGILNESVNFLDGRPVNPEDESYYDLPARAAETASLYQHCVRAIQYGLRFGSHGLPLMGSGDWNDGMNRVGIEGKGESVWLGFFLCEVLRQFIGIARLQQDELFAERCASEREQLRQNIEQHAWDGEWYRRAYFDDGKPLGSISNTECQIDSVSQSWSVLSGMGDEARSRMAMQSVNRHLIHRDVGIIQLLDPPFDTANPDPGYIRGYVPGVRENGGQYTHAAIWTAMAFAALGDGERAWELMSMINPVNHALNARDIYKVEPYVVSADVYMIAPHTGRGGWSWYTGSAGWMYRLIIESLLGLKLAGETLQLAPCLPADWPEVKIFYRYRETGYHITVTQIEANGTGEIGMAHLNIDGVEHEGTDIPLTNDQQDHAVNLTLSVLRNKAS